MADIEKESSSSRRVALTKKQRETQVGIDLLSLCQTVTSDGSLSNDEIVSLRNWLDDNKNADLPAISHLIPVVERILTDGVVTPDEQRELFVAIEAVLPPDVRDIAKKARRSKEQIEKDRLRLKLEAEKKQQQREERREERELNKPIERWDFMIAGAKYDGHPDVIDRYANESDPAILVRDSANKHDRNAIEVHTTSGHQIGFVPREDAADIAPFLDAEHPYSARIKKILSGGKYPIPVIVVDIYRKDATVPNVMLTRNAKPVSCLGIFMAIGFIFLMAKWCS